MVVLKLENQSGKGSWGGRKCQEEEGKLQVMDVRKDTTSLGNSH